MKMDNKIVKLNIGGTIFCTTAETLTKYSNTFFTSMLSDSLPTTKDESGAYFIDRDGQFFSPILTWLRTNVVSIPCSMTREDLLREAKYYLMDSLVEELLISVEQSFASLECPPEIQDYVNNYFSRHENTIITILKKINKEGSTSCSIMIIPGHRQDFERSPQILETGRLGLYMNFTGIHISKYGHVQQQLAICFKSRGFSGYYRPGQMMEL